MKRNHAASATNHQMIPAPINDDWGFFGILPRNLGDEATPVALTVEEMTRLWYLACQAVAATFQETNPAVVHNFLRSRWGRHLADEVADLALTGATPEAAIPQAIARRTPKGKLAWRTPFAEVRAATLDGSWTD